MTMTDDAWTALKLAVPVGGTVHGRVIQHARFGFFLELDDHPTANAVVLAPDFERERGDRGESTEPLEFPSVGSRVEADILDYVDLTKQIRLQVSPHHHIEAVN
jgi:ribosomal protein S1